MKIARVFAHSLLAITLLGTSHAAEGKMACSLVFQVQRPEVRALVLEDGYLQWLTWEQNANFSKYLKSPEPVAIERALVPLDDVHVRIDTQLAPSLRSILIERDEAVWLRHPWNTSSDVPFRKVPSAGTIPVYLTASRTVVPLGDLRGFTIKAPVDYPHGPRREYQPSKAETQDDVRSALIHSAHIRRQDELIGKDEKVLLLPEVATVAHKQTDRGYIIRDVRLTDDGHYYLPAFSIPYVGREIARLNHAEFEAFWEKNYAQLLGEAKARLLLRYGLQMETPNSQNMLIQLDRNLKPTGRIVFRDVSDALFVLPVARALGIDKELGQDRDIGFTPSESLRPRASLSLWRFDEAEAQSVSRAGIQTWTQVHNRAYVEYILKTLDLPRQVLLFAGDGEKPVSRDLIETLQNSDDMALLYRYLNSHQGQRALEDYRLKSQRGSSELKEAG